MHHSHITIARLNKKCYYPGKKACSQFYPKEVGLPANKKIFYPWGWVCKPISVLSFRAKIWTKDWSSPKLNNEKITFLHQNWNFLWESHHINLYTKKYRKAEYVQRHVCFVNIKCTVVFAVYAMLRILLYLSCGIPFLVWTPGIISGLKVRCGVAVKVRSHQRKFQVIS